MKQHELDDLTKLSARDLIVAREEAVKARDGYKEFYNHRFVRMDATNSNPQSLPGLVGVWNSEVPARLVRGHGLEFEGFIEDLENMIEEIDNEIVKRCKNN
jgi:hypothetical protein